MSALHRRRLDIPLGTGTPASPRLVVDVWTAVRAAGGWRALMLKRSPRDGGFWQGVSGRVESCDASLEAAALREIREETGIASGVEVLDLERWVDFVGPRSGLTFRKRSLGAIFPTGTEASSIRLSREHVEVRVVTFEEARALVSFPVNVEELTLLEALLTAREAEGPGPGRDDGGRTG